MIGNKAVWWLLAAGVAYVAWQAYQTHRILGSFAAPDVPTTQANGVTGAAVTGPNPASAGL